jgi:steroid delta-isomerase-like uncharacterized protein
MSSDNKAVALRLLAEVWNNRNLNLADELVSAAFVHHDPNTPDQGTGPEAYKRGVKLYVEAFPDVHFTAEEVIAEGNMVVLRWTAFGTHQGPLAGLPPTGRRITTTGVSIGRREDGKLAEEWSQWDALGLMRQLGALPADSGVKTQAA